MRFNNSVLAEFIIMKEQTLLQICDPTCFSDVVFVVAITKRLSDLNLKLQKQGQLVNQQFSFYNIIQSQVY